METPVQKIALSFLRSGKAGDIDDASLTQACVRLVLDVSKESYRRALSLSERFVRRSQGHAPKMRLMALRLLGQMNQFSGRHAEALKAYRKARLLAPRDPLAKAGMDRMLIDVYMYLGRYAEAKRAANRSMRVYARAGLKSDWHKARVNYANLLHRLDRHRDAGRIYREAAEFFGKAGDLIAAARCEYNTANTLVQLFEIDDADRSYGRARQIYEQEGFDLDACNVRYGQAWLRMLKGELHVAMLELGECAKTYREAGDRRGEALCNLDLAEVALGLGLFSDALDSARRAEGQFARFGLRYERAKAALFRGQAALSLGRESEAEAAATRARDGFKSEKNTAFDGVARLLFADLGNGTAPSGAQPLLQAARLFQKSQLPLWKAVCDLRLARLPAQSHRALQSLAQNKAAQVVPHLYAGWQTTLGDLHHGEGQVQQAKVCWGRAADRLDAVRSQLPPFELRSAYGKSVPSPHSRLVTAEAAHDPRMAAIWSERLKTAGVWAPITPDMLASPRRRRITDSLEALASQVAYLMRQMPGQPGARGMTAVGAQRTLDRLQRRLRQEFSGIETAAPTRAHSVGDLDKLIAATSERLPIIQFHVADNDIYGFVHQHGKTTLCTVRNGRQRIAYALERWRFFMERHLFSSFPGRCELQRSEDTLWAEVGSWLWHPLKVDSAAREILIVAEGDLANLPWQAMPVDGKLLAERHHITLAPSIRHFAAAEGVRVTSSHVQVFHGDVGGLPHTCAEVSLLKELLGDAVTSYSPSRRADWPTSGDSRIWHYTGHAVLRDENPFYSYLLQSDGPLFAADFRMRRCRVELATLAACQTGQQVAVPGEEATGLVRSLLEMGARNVVAGRWPVSDESASFWMTRFYSRYLRNDDLFTAARDAALEVRENYPSAYHWAAFAIFGAGLRGGPHEAN